MRNIYLLILLLFVVGCNHKKTGGKIVGDSVWAYTMNDMGKENVMNEDAKWGDEAPFFTSGIVSVEIPNESLVKARDMAIDFLRKKATSINGSKHEILKNYFRQYIPFKRNNKLYVLINMYAFYTRKFAENPSELCVYVENPQKKIKNMNPLQICGPYYFLILVNLTDNKTMWYSRPAA